ncbi:hypothetical protein [Phyllobacterium myrsinacearum]|uniref:Uncharacterized protein n=1 Tax=Phyllobacterium myrsinacearum TaxID=28101 RepID=A0A839EKE3_9HYPH|nr:hypothetical protein [Phyllobacterium myrsinacearum]MBA8877190.1 hypothetical protein [Phyllobacterium myrsinacearum]
MPQESRPKRRIVVIVLTIVTIIALLPLFSVLATYAIATPLGCAVDEGSVHPCLVGGIDIGDMLYTMGVLGWLMIPAAPVLLIAVLGWVGLGIAAVAGRMRRSR